MNLYFWCFSLYVLWIMPLSITTSLRFGKGIRHHTRIRIAGIPFHREEARTAEKRLKKSDVARGIFALDLRMILTLIHQGHLRRAFGTLRLEGVYVHMRISFADAALTAMSYAALRVLLQTALPALPLARRVRGRVDMDFEGAGSEMFVRCMFSARLGTLITAVLRLGWAVMRERSERLKSEEEPYAAASH